MKEDLISRAALLQEIAEWRMPSCTNQLDRHLDEFEEVINAMPRFEAGNDRAKLEAITKWLEKNQPDVFQRGLWDAVNAA